jgi:hypothetical protein
MNGKYYILGLDKILYIELLNKVNQISYKKITVKCPNFEDINWYLKYEKFCNKPKETI